MKNKPENIIWKTLSFRGKCRYLWDYYKLPAAIILILLYIAGHRIYRTVTQRDVLLYGALINVSVSSDLETQLSEGFLQASGADLSRETMQLSTGWYLTDHPDSETLTYSQATQMKILASINDAKLDFILMDKEAFDAFAQNGYLMDMDSLFSDPSYSYLPDLKSHLVTNMVILEDNAKEIALDPSVAYTSVTREYAMGIDLSSFPLIREAGFPEAVYLGILVNTPRLENVLAYAAWLSGESEAPAAFVSKETLINSALS